MSEDSPLQTLIARLETLEADAARFKRLAVVACAALVGVTAIGAASLSRANAPFSVLDASGHTRVRIDAAGLHVLDARGTERITVGFNAKSQPVIHLNDKTGALRQSIYLSPTQVPGLEQYDAQGNTRAAYDLSGAHSAAAITFMGADGNHRYYLVGSDLPFMRLGDAATADRMDVGLTTEGGGLLRMFDKSGGEIVSIEGQSDGPFLRMSASGNERVYLGVTTDGNELLSLGTSQSQDQAELSASSAPYLRLTDTSAQKRAYMGVYSDGSTGAAIWNADGTSAWTSP